MTEVQSRSSWIARRFSLRRASKPDPVWQLNTEEDVDLALMSERERRKSSRQSLSRVPTKSSEMSESMASVNSQARNSVSSKGASSHRSSSQQPLYPSPNNNVRLSASSKTSSIYSEGVQRLETAMSSSQLSIGSSGSQKRYQLVPKSLVDHQTQQNLLSESEDLRRMQEKLQIIGASERKARSESSGSFHDYSSENRMSRGSFHDYAESRGSHGNGSNGRTRSETGGSNRSGSVRIQYVPKRAPSPQPTPPPTLSDNSRLLPRQQAVISSVPRRINRSLTAVTEEEARLASEYQSEIDEEDEPEEAS